MSSDAVGWVYRHSPFKGATLLVHLAIADTANDQHEYRFWMRQRKLAVKARTSRSATQHALDDLVAAGMLVKLGCGPNGLVEYQFVMAALPTVYEPTAVGGVPADRAPADRAGVPADRAGGVPADRAPVNQGLFEPKGSPTSAAEGVSFDAFWQAYPRKVGKGDARGAWRRAMKAASFDEVMAGLARYATEVADRSTDFIKSPAAWLNGQRWTDEPGHNAMRAKPRAADRIDTDRGGPSGEIDLWEGVP